MKRSWSLVWVDGFDRLGKGQKLHLYEQEPGGFKRVCGTRDGDKVVERSDLRRVEIPEFVGDTRACERCIKYRNLSHIKPETKGARSVKYDPFGVFGGENDA